METLEVPTLPPITAMWSRLSTGNLRQSLPSDLVAVSPPSLVFPRSSFHRQTRGCLSSFFSCRPVAGSCSSSSHPSSPSIYSTLFIPPPYRNPTGYLTRPFVNTRYLHCLPLAGAGGRVWEGQPSKFVYELVFCLSTISGHHTPDHIDLSLDLSRVLSLLYSYWCHYFACKSQTQANNSLSVCPRHQSRTTMPSILARQPSTSSHDEGSLTIGSVALSSESVWTPVDLALMQHGHRRRSTVKSSTALSTESGTSLSINTGKPNRPVVLVNPYGATDYDICVLATFEDSPPDELCKLLQHFIIPVAPNCGHPTVGGDTAIVFDPPLHYQSPHQWLIAFRYTPKTPLVSYSQARVAGRTPSITPESMEWLENEEIARRNSLEHMVAQDPNLGEVLRAEAQVKIVIMWPLCSELTVCFSCRPPRRNDVRNFSGLSTHWPPRLRR